jgi:hypothetical protein
VSLLDKFKLDELNRALRDLTFKKDQASRNAIAHFCEHDGICINFTPVRATWHALAPCALKPWWVFLQPLRNKTQVDMHNQITQETNKATNIETDKETTAQKITTKNTDTEVTENA